MREEVLAVPAIEILDPLPSAIIVPREVIEFAIAQRLGFGSATELEIGD